MITNDFVNRIKKALVTKGTNEEFDTFNELEDWFLDNEELIHQECYDIGQLGYLIQDEIAELSYMDIENNSRYINRISELLVEILDIIET